MAKIIGALTTSHVPAIGGAMAKGLQQEPYWKPFFDGFLPVREWLKMARPDVAVVFYNDHGLNFFLDKMPTFAVGAAPQYRNADEGWGIPTLPPFKGAPELSWHIINQLVEREFDITTCQEMLVDHAFTLPLKLFWPEGACPVLTVPVCINTVQFPLPSAKRCIALGKAVGDAVASWKSDSKVVMIGTGGLSHQLDGERAGFINKPFDLKFMDSLINEPAWAAQYSIPELVEKTGTQGIELLMWLAARAAVPGSVRKVHSNYHIPISNTAAGMMAMEAVA
ncbi:gallate dioxygenase [soil metagenome]